MPYQERHSEKLQTAIDDGTVALPPRVRRRTLVMIVVVTAVLAGGAGSIATFATVTPRVLGVGPGARPAATASPAVPLPAVQAARRAVPRGRGHRLGDPG